MCTACDELLTLEHILLFGFDLTEARERHFTAQSLGMLFEDISLVCISDYLKEIDIF